MNEAHQQPRDTALYFFQKYFPSQVPWAGCHESFQVPVLQCMPPDCLSTVPQSFPAQVR